MSVRFSLVSSLMKRMAFGNFVLTSSVRTSSSEESRMTVGVMKTISSVLDWLLTSERKRYFTRGISQRIGISDRVV